MRRKKLAGDRVWVQVVKSVRSSGKVRQRILRRVGTATSAVLLGGLDRIIMEEIGRQDGRQAALFSPKAFRSTGVRFTVVAEAVMISKDSEAALQARATWMMRGAKSAQTLRSRAWLA